MMNRHVLQGATALALLTASTIPTLLTPDAIAQSGESTAQSAISGPQRLAGLEDFIDGVMAQQIASHEVAGATLAVVHDGEILFTRGYGYADVDANRSVDPTDTLFRPGSVSKLFTWTALMQLVERGEVDLDADVNTYIDFEIPDFDGEPVRVRDLFSHTPGMSDVSGISVATVEELTPYGDWIKQHIPDRIWAPGTETSYSNYGVALAGYIVERVSGEAFPDYVDRHIFEPLGMNSSSFLEPLPARLEPRMATGYEIEDGRFIAEPFELFSSIMPAGSGSSTADDMSRFMLALLGGGELDGTRILQDASVERLFTDTVRNTPDLPGMAHGFYVVRDAGPRLVGHGGNTGDFHSNLILAPEWGFGFFVSMTGGNESSVGRTDLTNAVLGRVFPQDRAPRVPLADGETVPEGRFRVNRRDYTQPPREEYDITVAPAGESAILITNRDETTYWEHIGPSTFELVTGARDGGPFERVRFHEADRGQLMSFSSQPYLAYRRVEN